VALNLKILSSENRVRGIAGPPAIGCRGMLAALRYNRAFTTRPRCPARVLTADMTPERFKQIERLFHEARARPAALRGAFLVEACG